MKNIFLLLSILMIAYSCSSQKNQKTQNDMTGNNPNDIPVCVKEMIKKFLIKDEKGFYINCPGDIYSYSYNGNTVYYIPLSSNYCMDVPNILYDSNCNIIARQGGRYDQNDSKMKDFFEKRTNEKLVWKFER